MSRFSSIVQEVYGLDKKYLKDLDFIKKNNQEILWLAESRIAENMTVPLLKFHNLDKTGIVKHGFTTRAGGVSEGIFSSMNLCMKA